MTSCSGGSNPQRRRRQNSLSIYRSSHFGGSRSVVWRSPAPTTTITTITTITMTSRWESEDDVWEQEVPGVFGGLSNSSGLDDREKSEEGDTSWKFYALRRFDAKEMRLWKRRIGVC